MLSELLLYFLKVRGKDKENCFGLCKVILFRKDIFCVCVARILNVRSTV